MRLCGMLLAGGRDTATPVTPELDWGRFQADVSGLSARLRGTQRGLLWSEDGYAFAVGLFGMIQAGCTPVLPPHVRPALLAELSGTWDVIVGDDVAGAIPPIGEPAPPPNVAPDAATSLEFFTSGSTGSPKRIVRHLEHLEHEATAIESTWGGPELGVTHAMVPHQHAYGLPFQILWPLLAGRAFHPVTHVVWESLPATPGIVIVSSPAHLSRLGGLPPQPLAARVFSAGAPLSSAAADDVERTFGIAPIEIFGSTETGMIASRIDRHAWQPLPGNRITAAPDRRLLLDSPWGEGLHTGGDLIALAPDGGFTLEGRADRVVKIAGKRVSLHEVEAALAALPQVADAAVAELRDELVAVLVLTPAGDEELRALRAFRFGRRLRTLLADRLEPMARPRRFRFIAALPVNQMGKPDVSALTQLFGDKDV